MNRDLYPAETQLSNLFGLVFLMIRLQYTQYKIPKPTSRRYYSFQTLSLVQSADRFVLSVERECFRLEMSTDGLKYV